MLVRFQFLEGTTYDSYSYQWAEKSPLMLAGYSVSATKGYSDEKRRKILSVIIENGIVEKHEVIKYINFFISTKKNQLRYKEAISKWNKDLEFVRNYKIGQQYGKQIKDVLGPG